MEKDKVHIIPSGSDSSFCGLLKNTGIKGTSLGMTSNCEDCNRIAEIVIGTNK